MYSRIIVRSMVYTVYLYTCTQGPYYCMNLVLIHGNERTADNDYEVE